MWMGVERSWGGVDGVGGVRSVVVMTRYSNKYNMYTY